MDVIIERVYLPTETLGSLYVDGQLICKTMELPWKDNRNGVSCIPEGSYPVTKEPPIPKDDVMGRHERKYWHFRLHDTGKRQGILIHLITFVKDLRGCVGVGDKFADLNKDGVPDMVGSTKALQALIDLLPDNFVLTIKQKSK